VIGNLNQYTKKMNDQNNQAHQKVITVVFLINAAVSITIGLLLIAGILLAFSQI
jgi:hypothetical protein